MGTNDEPKKKSLILAGGGVRLAYHAGVLKALEEHHISFNHIDATSGGIFGAAMLASGISAEEAGQRWRDLKLKNFLSGLPLKYYLSQRTLPALGANKTMRTKIFPALGIDVQKINQFRLNEITFNVCNFSNKTIEAIHHKDVSEDHLIAGMSLPIFMPSIKIKNDWYTDAVWIKDANLTEAVNRGAEEIWLVWCIGNTRTYHNGFLNQYVHMIEISANGALFDEISQIQKLNTQREKEGLKPIVLHVIKPRFSLPLDPDFFLNKIDADTLINMGYADTKQYLHKPLIFNFNKAISSVTAMEEADQTLHFRQQFFGQIVFEKTIKKVEIHLIYYIRQNEDHLVYQQFSSIKINQQFFISGYNNVLNVLGKGELESEFEFICNGEIYHANLKIILHSLTNTWLGLSAKTAKVMLGKSKQNDSSILMQQPAKNRIKNAFYLNVKSNQSWFKRIAIKRNMLNLFFK